MHTTLAAKYEDQEQRRIRFSNWYDNYFNFNGEPTTITVHSVTDSYGGPEEGGWWFQCGTPVETICIFSKTQAVNELLRLHEKYESEEYEDFYSDYDINLSQNYAEYYPVTRPHYE